MVERIRVNDYEALGQFFIDVVRKTKAEPTTLAEFTKAANDAGAGLTVPGYLKSFQWCPPVDTDVLQLRRPPQHLVQDTLHAIAEGGAYGMPANLKNLYDQFINNQLPADRVFRFRVGDYVIAHCW